MTAGWLLYDNPLSGNCWKARQILTWTDVSFRSEEVSVIGDRETDRAATPVGRHHAGRIPLLVGPDGTLLAESGAILLWFGEGTAFLPDDRLTRHRAHEWLFFEQSAHMPSLAAARYLVHILGEAESNRETVGFLQARGRLALARMEQHLAGREWFAGDSCTVADIALYPYTKMAPHAEVALDGYPQVCAWLKRVESRDGFVALPCL